MTDLTEKLKNLNDDLNQSNDIINEEAALLLRGLASVQQLMLSHQKDYMSNQEFNITVPQGFLDKDLETALETAYKPTHALIILQVQNIRLLQKVTSFITQDAPSLPEPEPELPVPEPSSESAGLSVDKETPPEE